MALYIVFGGVQNEKKPFMIEGLKGVISFYAYSILNNKIFQFAAVLNRRFNGEWRSALPCPRFSFTI